MVLNEQQIDEIRRTATDLGQFLRVMQNFKLPVEVCKFEDLKGKQYYATKVSDNRHVSSELISGNGGYSFEMLFSAETGDGAKFQRAWTGVEDEFFRED